MEGASDQAAAMKSEPGAPMTLGNAVAAGAWPIAIFLVIVLSGCGAGRGNANAGPNPGGGFNIGAEHGDNGGINP
jgi:hypothetical protein